MQGQRTHCRNGHEWTPDNTYVRPDGKRVCRECYRARNRAQHYALYADPDFRERRREYLRNWRRERNADPEWRERELERVRQLWADPEYRQRQHERRRERYRTDPEYRERVLAATRERNNERYRTDDEYREQMISNSRERYYSSDPETHRKVSAETVRGNLKRRQQSIDAKRANPPRPKLDIDFIDQIIEQELSNG